MVSVLAASNQWGTTMPKFFHSSLSRSIGLVDQQNPVKYASNIHPNVYPKYPLAL